MDIPIIFIIYFLLLAVDETWIDSQLCSFILCIMSSFSHLDIEYEYLWLNIYIYIYIYSATQNTT